MARWLDHCTYCIRKAVEKGKLEEDAFYEEDNKAIKDFDPAYPVYDNHSIFVFYACEACEAEQRKKYDPVIFNDYIAYEEKAMAYGEKFEPED